MERVARQEIYTGYWDRRAWNESVLEDSPWSVGHGLHCIQIQQAAAKAGQEVRAYCDEAYKPFQVGPLLRRWFFVYRLKVFRP